ncbi:response regulator transcription factor [Xanthomonas euvesicatoria pv. euvesicatoria]|nr:LuxR C-terminal-related transcriptional regulator [Xanthomonas euvesicatoria]OCG95431.1 LuxR family transcriptional regulator [Xanthomonas euvesicatoria]
MQLLDLRALWGWGRAVTVVGVPTGPIRMQQPPPIMFVLVDASRWQAPGLPLSCGEVAARRDAAVKPAMLVMGDGAHAPCVLLRSDDLDGIDAQLDEWIVATATRFADAMARYAALTPRERQALQLVTDGLLNKQAAAAMGISEATLQIHRKRVMDKMGARSFAELVRIADLLGLSGDACHPPVPPDRHNARVPPRPRRLGARAA